MRLISALVLVAFLFMVAAPALAMTDEQRKVYDSNVQWFDVDGGVPPECTPGQSSLSGSDNAERVWNFLTGAGLTPEQAAGVMGNLQAESGFDPFNQENGQPWESGGWGIAQWTGGRRHTLRDRVKAELGPEFYVPTEEAAGMIGQEPEFRLLGFQLQFLQDESLGRRVRATPHPHIQQPPAGTIEWDGLKTMTTVDDATYYWEWNFERPGVPHTEARLQMSRDILARFGSSSGGGGGASGGVTCGSTNGTAIDGYSLPLDRNWFEENPNWLTKTHHDYPATDLPVPIGTPVYSMTDGRVITAPTSGSCGTGLVIDAGGGVTFSYCHGSDGGAVEGARQGDTVTAGQLIMTSDNTGNSTGPHLHVGIKINGQSRCPQPLLEGIYNGTPPDVTALPSSGCTH